MTSTITRAAGRRLLALLILGGGLVTALLAEATPASAAVNCDVQAGPLALNDDEGQLLRLLNAHRAANGQGALQQSETLRTAATWLAVDSAARKTSGHVDSLNRDIPKRFEDCGYGGFQVPQYGFWENVCCTNGTAVSADAAMGWWKGSPGHNENMLRPNVRFVGVARECASANQCYWVLTLGTEPSGTTSAVPAAHRPQPRSPRAPAHFRSSESRRLARWRRRSSTCSITTVPAWRLMAISGRSPSRRCATFRPRTACRPTGWSGSGPGRRCS